MIAPASSPAYIFPDPWHKKKHNKRRLIQPEFVARTVTRLAPGGYLHCATDWQPHAEQMLRCCRPSRSWPTPPRAMRRSRLPAADQFENRGLKPGHGVWDLVFTRSS